MNYVNVQIHSAHTVKNPVWNSVPRILEMLEV